MVFNAIQMCIRDRLDLWLQRAVYKYDQTLSFGEPLAQVPILHDGKPVGIWNNDWLNQEAIDLIMSATVVDVDLYANNSAVTTRGEAVSYTHLDVYKRQA